MLKTSGLLMKMKKVTNKMQKLHFFLAKFILLLYLCHKI